MLAHLPRVMVTAPRSGSGKTTLTCALLGAFAQAGLSPLACKAGPDYVDPTFHAQVGGVPTLNLDLFFQTPGLARELLAREARRCDVAVVEGAMGYYDGIAAGTDASAWHLACETQTPALLVVDGRGASASLAAQVLGFVRMREPSRIAGVVLNRTSPAMADRVAGVVERECGVPVVGCLPQDGAFELPSRHLGLVPAGEVDGVRALLDGLARTARQTLDLDRVLAIAATAPDLRYPAHGSGAAGPRPVLAVARDEAFCFYYAEELRLFEELGLELAWFSPLRDEGLPAGTCGIYLGGGYPELHARELCGNAAMRAAVHDAVLDGVPTLAECGGFLYLHRTLEDADGRPWEMAGVVDAAARRAPRHGRFGYVELSAGEDGLLGPAGTRVRGHEFHHWDSEAPGGAWTAAKPQSGRSWPCALHTPTLYAGFPHLYLPGSPDVARRFADACRTLQAGRR